MHDALRAYESDCEVREVEDWRNEPTAPAAPAISRRVTREVIVHVIVDGVWHRRSPGLGTTACGAPIHSQFAPVRPERLEHPLARGCGCFTKFELSEADKKTAEET